MSKITIWMAVIVVLVIGVAAGGYMYTLSIQSGVAPSPVSVVVTATPTPTNTATVVPIAKATLMVEQGTIQQIRGVQTMMITNESEVLVGDQLKTGANDQGFIIFPDNDVIRLATNTHITLQALVSSDTESKVAILQSSGNTWSHVQSILDRKHDYSVQSPTLVATVRGTVFNFSVDASQQQSWVGVYESKVDVTRTSDQSKVLVSAGDFATENNGTGQSMAVKKMEADKMDSPWFKQNITKDQNLELLMEKSGQASLSKDYLRKNRASFFKNLPSVQPTLNIKMSPAATVSVQPQSFDPALVLRQILKEMVAKNYIGATEAEFAIKGLIDHPDLLKLKSEAEVRAYVEGYLQSQVIGHPGVVESSPAPSPLAKVESDPTSAPEPTLNTSRQTSQPTSTISPSPSPSGTLRFSPIYNFSSNNLRYIAPSSPSPDPIK